MDTELSDGLIEHSCSSVDVERCGDTICIQHEQLICNNCLSNKHNKCITLTLTSALESVDLQSTLKNIQERTDLLKNTITTSIKAKEENILLLKQKSEEIKDEISSFRQRIIHTLDIMERDAHLAINDEIGRMLNMAEMDEQDLLIQKSKIEHLQQCVQEILIHKINEKSFRKLIEVSGIQKGIASFLSSNNRLRQNQDAEFQWNGLISELQEKSLIPTFGQLIQKLSLTNEEIPDIASSIPNEPIIELYRSIDHCIDTQNMRIDNNCSIKRNSFVLKSSFDTLDIEVNVQINRGCFISNNRVLLKDMRNSCIYLLNVEDETFQKRYLEHEALDIAVFDCSRAVVTLREGGIQVINIPSLTPGERIRCGGSFYAVACTNNTIFVRTSYRKLTVFDITGKHQKTMETEFVIDYMCVNKNVIYCTNYCTNRVFALTTEGIPVFSHELTSLKGPVGVTVDKRGLVYVAGWLSNNIHQFDEEGNLLTIIGTEKDDIYRPMGLSYNSEEDCLMVINKGCISISVYDIMDNDKIGH
ncbi:uncharacterized protein LOC127727023 [Mytilus californianus]|uniref:uncharacterized protein LOC127727023 n=1 Tax=Mytilus californianus TaxID=6549 RepID=UPI002245715B|nr:uncharacterized protein LOC127727023 [Mytilus californianus]XP_052090371.1 uncharacterized protein LOC127727023 [Mytilus californianus]